jgi:hypothetical protein
MLVNLTFHYSKLFSAGVDVDTALGVALVGAPRLT